MLCRTLGSTIALLAATLALVGCDGDPAAPLLGTLERDRLELVAESQEPITRIAVTEGERVVAGQLLASLDPAVFEQRIAQARANVAQAERREARARERRRVSVVVAHARSGDVRKTGSRSAGFCASSSSVSRA